jgi:hypothetical protein
MFEQKKPCHGQCGHDHKYCMPVQTNLAMVKPCVCCIFFMCSLVFSIATFPIVLFLLFFFLDLSLTCLLFACRTGGNNNAQPFASRSYCYFLLLLRPDMVSCLL